MARGIAQTPAAHIYSRTPSMHKYDDAGLLAPRVLNYARNTKGMDPVHRLKKRHLGILLFRRVNEQTLGEVFTRKRGLGFQSTDMSELDHP